MSKNEPEEVDNSYKYYKYIYAPKEMGITVGDSLRNVENGVAGIFSYVKLLVEGKSNASKTGKPLGNKYFLETEQNCIHVTETTKKQVKRSLYIDNVPTGTGGILKDTGEDFSDFKGLVPGAIEDVMAIGKIDFFSAFTELSVPKCLPVKLKTIDINNNQGSDTQYITLSDIEDISPCNFIQGPNDTFPMNPITKDTCKRQGFTVSEDDENNAELYKDYYKLNNDDGDGDGDMDNKNMKLMMPDDVFLRVLFYSLGGLSIYIALKLMANMYKKRD
jgi:hypothetical protein